METTAKITWQLKHFNDLKPRELYGIVQLRQLVFVVEQTCPYLDADGKDMHAWHLSGWLNDEAMACARLLSAGTSYVEPSIGRVVTHPRLRRTGIGKELMRRSLLHCEELFGNVSIRIGAQQYLKRFYESFGFVDVNKPYIEDSIPHLEMLRQPD